jgi:hypothetical protein
MKHALDTPTITAHALGELSGAETRLLRMTFHDSIAARDLDEESTSIRQAAQQLSRILKADAAETNSVGLSDERRARILELTSAPYPHGKSAPVAPAEKAPLTMERILAERKSFDNRPSRMATYLTAGAAAAVILLLSVLRTKSTTDTTAANGANGSGTGTGTVAVDNPLDTRGATIFKIVTPSPEQEQHARDSKRALVGGPASSVALPKVTVPQGPTLPNSDLAHRSTDIPAPKRMNEKVVKIPSNLEAPNPEQPTKEEKPQVYAYPKK